MKKAIVWSFSEWPLSQNLVEAYELDVSWLDVPIYFATFPCAIGDLGEEKRPADDDRVVAITTQLGQCFLRDPVVRSDFYEGGARALHCGCFPGIGADIVKERLRQEGAEVGTLASLLDKRHAQEGPPGEITSSFTSGEGIVDRHRRIREALGLSDSDSVAATLREPANWRYGLSSAAFFLLSQAGKADAWSTISPSTQVAAFLGDLFLGHAKHRIVAEHLVRIFRQPRFEGIDLPLRCLAELVAAVPEAARELARARVAKVVQHDDATERFRLARALWRVDPGAFAEQLRETAEACVVDPNSASRLHLEADLPLLFEKFPALTLGWLPRLWQDQDADALRALFDAAAEHLPKRLDYESLAGLTAAAKKARGAKIRSPLGKLLKKHGLDIDTIAPLPKAITNLDVVVEVAVDGATLALLDPATETLGTLAEESDDLEKAILGLVNRGRAVAFHTGTDGTMRVRMTGKALQGEDRRRADEGTTFVIASSGGALHLESGSDRAELAVPKGNYQVTVFALGSDQGDRPDQPDYVFVFGTAGKSAKPARRNRLPRVEAR